MHLDMDSVSSTTSLTTRGRLVTASIRYKEKAQYTMTSVMVLINTCFVSAMVLINTFFALGFFIDKNWIIVTFYQSLVLIQMWCTRLDVCTEVLVPDLLINNWTDLNPVPVSRYYVLSKWYQSIDTMFLINGIFICIFNHGNLTPVKKSNKVTNPY